MGIGSEQTVWVATVAVGDDMNEPGTEIVGVFASERAARDAAARFGPRTASATAYVLGQPALP